MSNQNEGNLQESGEAVANRESSGDGSQPLEAKLTELNANLSAALKKLESQEGEIRALKSGKDKAVTRALEEIQPMKETVAKLAQYLNIPEADVVKAQKAMILDDLVNERMAGGNLPERPSEGTMERKGNAVEFQIVDELLDLPVNDSRVTQIKLDHGNDINAYKEAAKKLKQSLATGSPTPAELPLPTGSAPRPPGVEENMNKYINEMKDARGKGNQVGNAIKDKYRKLGVPVDEITFRV